MNATNDQGPTADPTERELAEVSARFSHSRLRLAREHQRLKQTELATLLELTAAAISQFEKPGGTRPSPVTLARMSQKLQFPVGFFAVQAAPSSRDIGLPETGGYFRSLRSYSLTDRKAALSVTHCVRDLVADLESRVQLPRFDVPRTPLTIDADPAEAEGAAERVRQAWGLGPGPIPNVLRVLEEHGIICVRYNLLQQAVDAFSVPFEPHPVVVLGSDKDQAERDRFTGSHELGHLVMHELEHAGTKTLETQAHRFAGAFLMPNDAAVELLRPRPDYRYLIDLKHQWGISVGALLRRSRDVGVMSPKVYTQAVKYMSMRGWTKSEPGNRGAIESPGLLSSAATAAAGDDSAGALSLATGWPQRMIAKLLAESRDPRPALSW